MSNDSGAQDHDHDHNEEDGPTHRRSESLIYRSWHAMTDLLSPFSSAALASLPKASDRARDHERRTDNYPDTDGESVEGVYHRDYQSINRVRVPKKIATPIKVEGKVWFANERTWVSYLNIAILLGALSLALFNASKDEVARDFAIFYAIVSGGVLVYGWVIYEKRITMIRRRDPGHFDQILGPIVISALLFFAVLANFIIRVQEMRRKNVPIPGEP